MADQPSLDRRDFMLATIGGAALSAALSSDRAEAQTATATLPGGTVYTGDVVQEKPVVMSLNDPPPFSADADGQRK